MSCAIDIAHANCLRDGIRWLVAGTGMYNCLDAFAGGMANDLKPLLCFPTQGRSLIVWRSHQDNWKQEMTGAADVA